MGISHKSILKPLLILSPARALHAIGLDILLTSIPQIQASLKISQVQSQLIVSTFVLATSISHLFIGPLADKFGRRAVMLGSILFFIIGSWICTLSNNISQLIFSRVLQGIGACGTTIGVLAIVRDLFDENERAQFLSYMNGLNALSPLLAPTIGSFFWVYFGTWQSNFHFLIWFSVISFLLCFFYLDETKPVIIQNNIQKSIWYEYWQVLTNPKFLSYVIPGVSSSVTLLMFFSVSSILVVEVLHESIHQFALLFGSNALVYMLGSFLAPMLLKKFKLSKCIIIGSVIMMSGSCLLLISKFTLPLSLWTIFIPNYLQTLGSGIIFGNTLAGALEPFRERAGIAAAVYGFVQHGLSSIIAAGVMIFEINSMVLPAITMMILSIINIMIMRSKHV